MNTYSSKISSFIIIGLVFLLPILYLPGQAMNLYDFKSALFVFGVLTAVLVALWEAWRRKELLLPWHPLILAAVMLPLGYLLSAISSSPSSLSVFGYNFEPGTFGHMFFATLFFILVATALNDAKKLLGAFSVVFVSLLLTLILFAAKLISTLGFQSLNFLFAGADNSLGRWTDLSIALGLISILAILAIGIMPMKKVARLFIFTAFLLAVTFLAIVNFSISFILTAAVSILMVIYFLTIERHFLSTGSSAPPSSAGTFSKPVLLSIILSFVSLLMLINPVMPGARGSLGDVIANITGVTYADVRPSFSATLSVSQAALANDVLLGSGPNTFDRDWLIHRPMAVNTTPFWRVAFPFGSGFIPTQIASTGALGLALWLLFVALLVNLGFRLLSRMSESRIMRFLTVSSLLAVLYLWSAMLLYVPSPVMIALAFFFSGILLAVGRLLEQVPSRSISFSASTPISNFSRALAMASIVLILLGVSFVAGQRSMAAFYFKKAVNLSNTTSPSFDSIIEALEKAVLISPQDIHFAALSRVHFVRAQMAAANTSGKPEENLAVFEGEVSKSIAAAREAVNLNPSGYSNWMALGSIYSALVPPPLSVEGAYENAIFAYDEAAKRNPMSPEIPLLKARLELNRGNVDAARSLARASLALKEDYADAYLFLTQLELQNNNIKEAIASAERVAILLPGQPSIYFELGLLKYSQRDFTGAAEAFSAALALVPDYANAQYYLGLSLIQLGRLDEARAQFEALAVTNPDNEEVRTILESLREGKSPF